MSNLNIIKETIIEGGSYEDIHVFDQLIVNDVIHAKSMVIYDHAEFHGFVKVNHIKVSGNAIFHGEVLALDIEVTGHVTFKQNIKTNRLVIKNEVKAEDSKIEAYETILDGMGTFRELDCFQLSVNGYIRCSGLLRSNQIELKESSRGTIQEIIGSIVHLAPKYHQIKIHHLFAYQLYLENVSVQVIKTRNMEQGANNQIGEIIYM